MKSDVKLTPYKYNGGQNYQNRQNQSKKKAKYTINLDWLECTYDCAAFIVPKHQEPREFIEIQNHPLALVRDYARWNGTRHYRHVYNIHLHGEEFATMLCNPRSSIFNRDQIQLKVENHCLYEKGMIDRLNYLCDATQMNLKSVTRLDIAIDGQGFLSNYEKLIKGEYQKLGRAKMKTEHNHSGGVEGFYIGGKGSEKFLRGYNKTKEMRQSSSSKTYIPRFWANNSLGVQNEVERLELTMRAKAVKRVPNFTVQKLDQSSYLAGLMKSNLEKWYEFVVPDKQKNVSRKKKVQPVDWSYFSPTPLNREVKVDKPNVIWAVKRAITFEMQEFFARCEVMDDNLFAQAYARSYDRAQRYGITDWYTRKMPYWSKDRDYHKLIQGKLESVKSHKNAYSIRKFLEV